MSGPAKSISVAQPDELPEHAAVNDGGGSSPIAEEASFDIDVCLHVYGTSAHILWVLVYVDDALIVDNSPPLRKRFVDDLANRQPLSH